MLAYNNPYDTKVDLTPSLLARLYGDGLIVAELLGPDISVRHLLALAAGGAAHRSSADAAEELAA